MFNILVVDDDSSHRYLLIRIIKKIDSDFGVFFEAEDGKEALDILEIISIDAVFTDIRMPNKTGLEFLQEIKKLNETIDVVLVSSYGEFDYVKEGLILGAFDYILKPIDKELLMEIITRLKKSIQNKKNKKNFESIILDKFDSMYLNENVSKLVELMQINMDNSKHYAIEIFETLYTLYEKDFAKLHYVIHLFISMILSEIKGKYPWLHNYQNFDIESLLDPKCDYDKEYLLSKILSIIDKYSSIISGFKFNQTDSIIKQLCEYIAQNSDKKITLDIAANKFNFNSDYLGKLFKLKTGENFINYVNKVKMERAKYLLSLHKHKNYEIADMLGYVDSDYFSKLFTKYTGISPTSYKSRDSKNL